MWNSFWRPKEKSLKYAWFQQDVAAAHTVREATAILKLEFAAKIAC